MHAFFFGLGLELFLESRSNAGRVIALDEAHKVHFITSTFSDVLSVYAFESSDVVCDTQVR